MAREVDVIFDEHCEVFGNVQERRPEREMPGGGQWASGTTGFWFLVRVIAVSEEKCSLVGKTFLKI